MLVEAILVGIAMVMYVGAEWTAKDVLEQRYTLNNKYDHKRSPAHEAGFSDPES